jgi:hypothetical protein
MAQYQQTRTDLAPYRNAGQGALGVLSNILGIGGGQTPTPTPAPTQAPASAASAAPGASGGWTFNVGGQVQSGGEGNWVTAYNAYDQNGKLQGQFPSLQDMYQALGSAPFAAPSAATPTPSMPQPTGTGATPTPGNALAAYGLSGLTFQPTQAQLEQTPGYQFDLSQGLNGVANSNAAQGRGISGAAIKGAAGYATGLANNTLTTQQGIFQQNLGNVINPLEWAANLGQNSAATTGQQGIAAVGNANNALIGGANASAAGTVGSANALSSGLSGLGNSATNYLLLNNALSGGSANPYSLYAGGGP